MNYEPYNQFSWKASDYATIQSSEFGVTVHITDKGLKSKMNATRAVRELTGMTENDSRDLVIDLLILHNTQQVRTAKETAAKLFAEAIKTLTNVGIPDCEVTELYDHTFYSNKAA